MCARIDQPDSWDEIVIDALLAAERLAPDPLEDARAVNHYAHNICPTDYADAVVRVNGRDVRTPMRFGLVPHWAKGNKTAVARTFRATFNARSETVFKLPAFRSAIVSRRCVVPVTGWHEWGRSKRPHFLHKRDGAPILLGAIWDRWVSGDAADRPSGPQVTSMSVITTPAGAYIAQLHDRSPLVLSVETARRWLDPALGEREIRATFVPYDDDLLEAYPVASAVNNVRDKSAAVVAPAGPPLARAS
jgi:putative SOS response-associated peptidase YedK